MPQCILALVWLINRGVEGSCDSGAVDCAKTYWPVVSVVFSAGSIVYGVYKGVLAWREF